MIQTMRNRSLLIGTPVHLNRVYDILHRQRLKLFRPQHLRRQILNPLLHLGRVRFLELIILAPSRIVPFITKRLILPHLLGGIRSVYPRSIGGLGKGGKAIPVTQTGRFIPTFSCCGRGRFIFAIKIIISCFQSCRILYCKIIRHFLKILLRQIQTVLQQITQLLRSIPEITTAILRSLLALDITRQFIVPSKRYEARIIVH
mmetsp:Transcript_4855/g.7069  ORF Transcript_4855/g.7069 Transcript_4855/m.7069 type:complete len:202 (+) Transcript_4855:620-1225(+)